MANPVFTTQPLGGQQPTFWKGSPTQVTTTNKFTGQGQNALSQLLSGGMQGMQNPYQGFDPIEQRARSQFSRNTIPSIAERFTSLGDNALSSGAFASQLGESAANLEEGLAGLRSQYGLQNRSQLLQELGLGLTPQFENLIQPRESAGYTTFIPALLQALSQGMTAGATGNAGGGLQALLQLFGGK